MVEVMTPWVSVKQAGGSSAKGLLEGLSSLLDAMDVMVDNWECDAGLLDAWWTYGSIRRVRLLRIMM